MKSVHATIPMPADLCNCEEEVDGVLRRTLVLQRSITRIRQATVCGSEIVVLDGDYEDLNDSDGSESEIYCYGCSSQWPVLTEKQQEHRNEKIQENRDDKLREIEADFAADEQENRDDKLREIEADFAADEVDE